MGKIICSNHGETGIVLVSDKIFNQLSSGNVMPIENIFVIKVESIFNNYDEYYVDKDFIEKFNIPIDRIINFNEIELLANTENDFIVHLKPLCNKCFYQIYNKEKLR